MKTPKSLQDQIKAKIKVIQKHREQLQSLLDSCQHPTTIENSRYVQGDYYDKAYTVYWNECTVCGKRSKETIDQHSYYG